MPRMPMYNRFEGNGCELRSPRTTTREERGVPADEMCTLAIEQAERRAVTLDGPMGGESDCDWESWITGPPTKPCLRLCRACSCERKHRGRSYSQEPLASGNTGTGQDHKKETSGTAVNQEHPPWLCCYFSHFPLFQILKSPSHLSVIPTCSVLLLYITRSVNHHH